MTRDLTSHLIPPAAVGPQPAMGVKALRAAADLYMMESLGVPVELLPSGLTGHPLHGLSVRLHQGCARRWRLLQSLRLTAATLTEQAALLAETAGRGVTPGADEGLNAGDVARVAVLTTAVTELDERLVADAALLRDTATLLPPGAVEPWGGQPTPNK